jgi:hypothetical protein
MLGNSRLVTCSLGMSFLSNFELIDLTYQAPLGEPTHPSELLPDLFSRGQTTRFIVPLTSGVGCRKGGHISWFIHKNG